MSYEVLIVGAGAAGVGCGGVLRHLGIERFALLDRHGVGASFDRWPEGMRFITPSFTSNAFGMLDLNAVALRTSPAFTLKTEHPTGKEYARYLRGVAKHFELPVKTSADVQRIEPFDGGFHVHTSRGKLKSKFVIWAAGEFQYPKTSALPGAEDCIHSASISNWRAGANGEAIVIGGYESGADAAFHLALAGKRVWLLDRRSPWTNSESDPSVALSPFTRDRLNSVRERVELIPKANVIGVKRSNGQFMVIARDGREWKTASPPVLATGFSSGLTTIREHFAWTRQGHAKLSECDESTRTPGLFVAGPQVRHGNVIFCFIYKYRQRFAVVANAIAQRLGVSTEPLDVYRHEGMFLDDLSCCGQECAC
jgi:putative flavoprotein involved in K+ transport